MSIPGTLTFNVDDFVEQVLRSPADHPVRVTGVADRSVLTCYEGLSAAASSRGLELLLVDCALSDGALAAAVRDHAVARSGRRSDATVMRLTEALDGVELGVRARMETYGRLWRALDDQQPVLLVVANVSAASADDRALLDFFVHHVYSDPVGVMLNDMRAWQAPRGQLVVTSSYDGALPNTVDFGESAENAVRAYLATDEVVRRFIASTQGDIARLERLVDDLPNDASQLSLFRYDRLSAVEQTLVEVLVLAGQAITADLLHDTAVLLGGSEFFARSLRGLENVGIVRRVLGDGKVAVMVEDADFAHALRTRLAEERRRDVHRALADAECARRPERPNAALVALNYVAAGELAAAAQFHAAAVGQLRRERRLPAAVRLVEQLAVGSEGAQRDAYELLLVTLFEELGDFRRAFDACDRVSSQSVDLDLRRGRLAARIGEWAQSAAAFDRVLTAIDVPLTSRREAWLGQADAEYSLGAHDKAVSLLTSLIAEIAGDQHSPSVRDRMLVSARNSLGKIAIVRSQFHEATDLFERNRELAAQWGWDEEVSRADANLGVVALHRDDHDGALQRLHAALNASDAYGALPKTYCLMNLATVYQRRGEYTAALSHGLEALRCAKMAGDDNAVAVTTRNLASLYGDIGDFARARTLLEHVAAGDAAHTLGAGWNMLVRGQIELDAEQFEEAAQTFAQLREERLTSVFGVPAALRLAETRLALGQPEAARDILTAVEVGERALYQGIAAALAARLADDGVEALELACVAWETLDEVGQRYDATQARLTMAALLVQDGREEQARTELQRELTKVRRVADEVPEDLREHFWSKPAHRALVAELRALDGDVPAACVVATAEPEVAPRQPTAAWRQRFGKFIGHDPRLLQVFRLIDKVAKSDAPVLTYGESGTGKELVAAAIHEQSLRQAKPFIKVNCGAFVENLLLSELFGHEKGAFTGATETKPGRFERANGGTLFLDEIGDISLNTQVALLRVLQEGTFERVGGTETLTTDVRVICATNKDLEAMVRRGEFRLDLYYRLKGVVIEMPPLRERRADIPVLANHFAATLGSGNQRFTDESLQLLSRYSWPGNVRELQSFVRNIVLFAEGSTIPVEVIFEFRDFFVSGELDESLPDVELLSTPQFAAVEQTDAAVGLGGMSLEEALVDRVVREGRSLADMKKMLEIECIKKALISSGGNVTQAADLLQMKRSRLSQIINGDDVLSALKARLAG